MSIMEDPYAALMGGPPPMDPAAMGAAPGPVVPVDEEPELDPVEHLRLAIEHAQAALVAEPDDADSQALSKVVSGLYQILASRQKESDQMMGNPTLLRTLRRSGA